MPDASPYRLLLRIPSLSTGYGLSLGLPLHPTFGNWSKLIMVSIEAGNLSKNRHLDVSDIIQLIQEKRSPFFGIALLYFGMASPCFSWGVISCPILLLLFFFIFHYMCLCLALFFRMRGGEVFLSFERSHQVRQVM